MRERAQQVAELVKSAIERKPAARSAFLDEECRSDPAMRAEIESLLDQQDGASRFIEIPALHLAAESFIRESAFHAGQTIGDYEIISLIGSGGMGEVYLAHDCELDRKVALKLVRRPLASGDMLRHFKREEHLLASLNHPNIAQLYGSGLTADGVPFFVMEYVEGQRLDDYCNERHLGTEERLQLFRKVCSAVAYAHQRLVIHRDLKPANVRVTGGGEPKLLDFGIAKLIDVDESQRSGMTLTLQGVMTPEYASPEQVRGESMTTASDVYSLGVVLYELLTSQRPYRLTNLKPHQIAQAITDQEPTRPGLLRHELAGDLETILLMALRKEPERRYSSVGQFSEDIRRYLAGRPIAARKDTWSYRSAKFVQRHRLGVTAATLVLLTLLSGIVATSWEERTARQEKAKAESISAFLEKILNYSNPYLNPYGSDGRVTTISEVLDEAARRLGDGAFADEPEVRAELERIIGASYLSQGKLQLGRKHLQKFVQLVGSSYGPDDPRRVRASAMQAMLLFADGKIMAAEKLYRQMLPQMRVERRRGTITAYALSDALCNLAYIRRTEGDSGEAESLFREALVLGPQLRPELRYLLGVTRSTLASTLADEGKFDEALHTAQQAVTMERAEGQVGMPPYGFSLTILGGFLVDTRDFAAGDAALREGEAIFRKLLSPSHLWLGDNLRNQAISSYEQGNFVDARKKDDEALKIYLESFGPKYDNYPTALITEGLILNKMGQSSEGEAILRNALQLRIESLPRDHFWVALAKDALGECLTTEGRYAEAEPLLLTGYSDLKTRLGKNNPMSLTAAHRLHELYTAWNKPIEAAAFAAQEDPRANYSQ